MALEEESRALQQISQIREELQQVRAEVVALERFRDQMEARGKTVLWVIAAIGSTTMFFLLLLEKIRDAFR